MKATELIRELEKLIQKHGDADVWIMYDDGCLNDSRRAKYYKKIEINAYSEYSNPVHNVIVIL